MPVTINASPTNGIVQTADGSGVMKLQSNGVTTNALAWVNFNGTGTVAIRSAYNVSSITDNGTGDYTLNFTTALSDASYAMAGTSLLQTGVIGVVNENLVTANKTTTTYRIAAVNTVTQGFADMSVVQVAIFGN